MQPTSQISTNWREPLAIVPYSTGVSLHSHTSYSEESLTFIHAMFTALPGLKHVFAHYEKMSIQNHGLKLDFERANWRPPLQPRMAWDVEARQIQRLGLMPLVSITDHDTVEAPLLLRSVPSSRHIPMSVEWTAPYGFTTFHLGIHNLPSGNASEWMRRFVEYTNSPDDLKLMMMLRELHELPQVLIVFNHPLWDLHEVGPATHLAEVKRFLSEARSCIHALELNGLRHAKENREVGRLAKDTGYLLISGGDRHGLEPNANINLTSAVSFNEFVEEIRFDRRSHILFMDQYQQRWEQRLVRSTLNAVTDFPEFLPGWQHWDERAFHPNAAGDMVPMRALWANGKPPLAMRALVNTVRLAGKHGLSAPLSLAFKGVNDPRPELEWS